MNRGYIKLFRKIEDCDLWKDEEPFCKRAAWQDLILMANHEDGHFIIGMSKIQVKRGQRWTSIEKLANRWRWSVKKVSRFIDLLVSEGMIYKDSSNKGTLITIVNYDVYQGFSNKKEVQPTEQMTEQRKNEGKTTDRATDRQTRMNKNDIKNDIRMNKKEPTASRDF